ncbi:tyrosine-type recombinase/integrase [Pseudomonas sp.]|uniref:tyrosine-type recombinase/integrase n=1 Tax=Pseudomonas sp. TaxID=306 RepID=UPI00326774F1
MTTSLTTSNDCHKLLEIALAEPWIYRREGRYNLRVRPVGSTQSCTLSLRTTNRVKALTHATRLLSTLRAFHLDQPDASWPDLKERLKEIAEDILNTRSVWSQLDMGHGQIYADIRDDLEEIAATESLSYAGAQAVLMGSKIMTAGEERLQGNLKPILGIIEELNDDLECDRDGLYVPVPICIADSQGASKAPQGNPSSITTTFNALYDTFKAERGADLSPNTKKNHEACTRVIVGFLGELDLLTHTRADMVNLRTQLVESGRKVGTINKLMTHLSMVIGWAVATGLLKHNYSTKLTIIKGSESSRKAFASDQLKALKDWALGLPADDWKQAAMLLGIASGGRMGEVHQLTGKDIYKDGDQWLMSINDEGDKTLKNSFSRRVVPLVGVPSEILEVLSGISGKIFKPSMSGFSQMLNQAIRDVLGTEAGTGLSFHSLRHSLSSDLKTAGVSVGIAQAILGHSSGSLAFDLYGGNASASMGLMVEALKAVRS